MYLVSCILGLKVSSKLPVVESDLKLHHGEWSTEAAMSTGQGDPKVIEAPLEGWCRQWVLHPVLPDVHVLIVNLKSAALGIQVSTIESDR